MEPIGFLLEEKKFFEALGKFDIKIVVNPLRFEPWYHKGLAFVYLREFGKQYGLDLLPLNPKDTKKNKRTQI
jgi:hypothetical protein